MKGASAEPGPQSPASPCHRSPKADALYIFTDKRKNLYSLCGSAPVSLQVS